MSGRSWLILFQPLLRKEPGTGLLQDDWVPGWGHIQSQGLRRILVRQTRDSFQCSRHKAESPTTHLVPAQGVPPWPRLWRDGIDQHLLLKL